jgi:hypothetical protein
MTTRRDPSERLAEISNLYEPLRGVLREVPHNDDMLWLIARCKKLEAALEKIDGPYEIDWADKARLRDFIKNQKAIARAALEDSDE